MDKKTLEALNASIRHWEENVAAEKPEDACVSGGDCALCDLYFDSEIDDEGVANCGSCPIKLHTGKDCCGDTPWYKTLDALLRWKGFPIQRDDLSVAIKKAWIEAAQAEVDFLKSLLPESEG